MTKFIRYALSCAVLIMPMSFVHAADVDVKWSNPDKYYDIDPAEEHRQHFKERVFKSFEEHFAEVANWLPENQKLVLDFTNIDLAGDVDFGGSRRVRVVKDMYFPRMEFSYQLINADNSVVKSENVSLKDMGFLMHSRLKYKGKPFSYEKEMFDDWFKKTFENYIVK